MPRRVTKRRLNAIQMNRVRSLARQRALGDLAREYPERFGELYRLHFKEIAPELACEICGSTNGIHTDELCFK